MNFSRYRVETSINSFIGIVTFSTIFFLSSQIASATPPPLETTPNPDDISRIELNTSVSKQSGSYNQSYPIVVPPGRTGLAPNISLDYSSQSSDYTSPVGYGWNINIPYIERINKTGLNKLFTANYFSSTMDGELVASGTTGYRPEIESGSFNTYSFTNGVWTSYDKKGTKYTYGSTSSARLDNTASSSQVSRWYLSEILDTNGNKITFTYFKDAGQIYPDNIGYSFVGSNPLHKIVFERASTTARVSYRNGFQVETKYRISSINTYFDNSLVKNYKLEFNNQTSSKIPLLASIQETGLNESSASTTLPKSTFAYSSTSPTMSWLNNSQWASTTPHDLAWQYSRYPAGADNYYNRVSIQDMNGDAYPDWLYGDQVHLSDGQGWAASSSWSALPTNDWTLDFRLVDINGDLLPDVVQSKDIIYDPQFSGYTNSQIRTVYINNGNGTWSTSSLGTFNIPTALYTQLWVYPSGVSYTKAKVDFVDMNGDGLADWISDGVAYLNNGNGWSTSTVWGGLPTSFGKTAELADINGDGLPDIVTSEQWAYAYIYNLPSVYYRNCQMNQGNGTWVNDSECGASIPGDLVVRFQNHNTNPLVTYSYNDVYLVDMTGDGLPDWYEGGTVYPNTGRGWATSTAYGLPVSAADLTRNYRLEDVNGDQMLDYVYSHSVVYDTQFDPDIPTATYREVLINQGKKPWLLSTTTNIYGGTTTIAYKTSTELVSAVRVNPNNPFSLYTVASVKVDPGVGPKVEISYSHSGADYYTKANDPFTRKFAGFGTTSEITDLANKTTFYHQGNGNSTTSNETSDDYHKIGQSYRTEVYAPNNNLFQTTVNLFSTSSVATGSVYVRLTDSVKLDYDGDGDRRDTAVSYTYNTANGNVLTQTQWGEVTGNQNGTFSDTGTDKRVTTYTYASNTSANIKGLLATERLDNQSGTKIKESRYYYDTLALGSVNKGNLTKTEAWATSSTYINTQSSYNAYGLKTQDLDPRGNATNYVYDSFNLYPATTTNALSQSTKYTYDYTSGKVKTVTDPNGYVHESIYDGLDRLIEQKEPRGTSGALVTVEENVYTDATSSVSVRNKKYLDATATIDSYVYLDGLGRPFQSRQEAENANQFIVRDTVYGTDGNIAKESLPYFSTGTARTTATTQNNLYNRYAYDALNRKVSNNNVLGTTTLAYDQWQETITDTLGNIKKNNYDAYGNLASVLEQNGTSTYTTTYEWTPHNQLAKVTDALGNVRSVQYDGLGRRLGIEDLHASSDTTFGKWSFSYDAAGNLATTTDPKSQVIVTTYDALNRPTAENFTGATGIEASYVYDICTNGKGYICTSVSTAATTTRTYNPAGVLASEQKTIGTTTYNQSYLYDRQNNQTQITYPDNSDVKYTFNTAGLLEKVEQRENGGSYRDLISNYNYSPTGQITYQLHGNGASTTKTYDENELYRLRTIVTTATNPTGGGGELAQLEAEFPLLFEDATVTLSAEEVPESADTSLLGDDLQTASLIIEEPILATSTPPEVLETPISESVIVSTPIKLGGDKIQDIKFITNAKEAEVWRRYHKERLAYFQSSSKIDQKVIDSAAYAKERFDSYLIEKKYINTPEDEISTLGSEVAHFITKTIQQLAQIILPERAYAYLFNKEDFETCSTLPCSLSSNLAWGSAVPSLDATSRVAGVDSLKTVVTGEGGASLETANYNTSEIWSQFKIYVPATMTWGTSSYFTAFKIEDPANSTVFWMSIEDYGTPRLTVMGDVLGYTDTGLNLIPGAINTIEIRVKTGNGTGDVDIWLNNSTQGSPSYNGSGSMNLGTDNIDDILFGLHYAPETGIATTYYDDFIVDNAFIGTSTGSSSNASPTAPTSLQTEDLTNPTAVTDSTPEFSAIYNDPNAGDIANKYRLQVATSSNFTSIYFDTGTTTMASTTAGNRSANFSYSGNPLASSTTYYWRIKFIDDENAEGAWSTATATFVLASSSGGTSTTTLLIYGDSLVSGWDNWSYGGTYNQSGTAQVYVGTYSFESSITSQYGGVQLRNASLNTTGYSTLNFRFYLSSGTGVNIQMRGVNKDTNTDLGYANLSSYLPGGTYATGTWHQVTVPLADLGLTNFVGNGAIILQSNGSPTVLAYLDDIKFVGTTTATSTHTSGFVPVVQHLTYTYDSVGNITQIVDRSLTKSSATTTYTYDPLYRLFSASTTMASSTPYKETYAYNATGNITSKSNLGSYTYAGSTGSSYANPHAPTTINGVTHSYDLNGNLASTSASQTNTWDYRNRLLTATKSGTSTTYLYDTNEQRVQKTVGGKVTRYPSQNYETLGTSTTKHIYANGTLVSSVEGTGSTTATIFHNHQDHLGSTAAVTSDIGYMTRLYNYYPYGSLRLDEGSTSTTFVQSNQFIGQNRDAEADLSYLNARYYSSNNVQFTSQDPVYLGDPKAQDLKNPQNLNSYSYGTNNPIVNKDPEGEFSNYFARWNMANAATGGYLNQNVQAQLTGYTQATKVIGYAGLSLAPGTGDLIAASEAYTGRDTLTGNKLSWGSRGLAVLSTIPGAGAPADVGRGVKAARATWSPGQSIYTATKNGAPSWSTVRSRFWKNEFYGNPSSYSELNLDRMRQGLAPQRFNTSKWGYESMELSHEPVPFRYGGTNVVPRWPQDHARVDPYRRPGY